MILEVLMASLFRETALVPSKEVLATPEERHAFERLISLLARRAVSCVAPSVSRGTPRSVVTAATCHQASSIPRLVVRRPTESRTVVLTSSTSFLGVVVVQVPGRLRKAIP